ncbi:MAG: hypothetical protein CM15mP83_7020 [Flavobacteriaceae bacterium]|nr:MAG: hypothetical protein CM15mP83_7020 [Flavobacteriaceae bacterium]
MSADSIYILGPDGTEIRTKRSKQDYLKVGLLMQTQSGMRIGQCLMNRCQVVQSGLLLAIG